MTAPLTTSISLPNVRTVTTYERLCALAAEWALLPQIAFDLEFDRDRHTYGFDLCLIQIAAGDICYIIDPKQIEDITPVFALFENPAVQKIIHCPGEDLRLLHSLKCYPQNLADTEVIAKLLNYEHTSLARLLEQKKGIVLDKKLQQSNWQLRPLTDEQLLYAAYDVFYLHYLYDVLMAEATGQQLTEWVLQEFQRLSDVRYDMVERVDFLRPGDYKSLSPRKQYILNELFKLRDDIARAKNKPAYMIMPEAVLRQLMDGVLLPAYLPGVKSLHPSLKHGKTSRELITNVTAILTKAQALNLDTGVNRHSYSPQEKQAFNTLKEAQHQLKTQLIEPLQKCLVDKLGTFAARYVLSNAWVNRWMQDEHRWTDLQPAYRKELVKQVAAAEGLPYHLLEEYEEKYGGGGELAL